MSSGKRGLLADTGHPYTAWKREDKLGTLRGGRMKYVCVLEKGVCRSIKAGRQGEREVRKRERRRREMKCKEKYSREEIGSV